MPPQVRLLPEGLAENVAPAFTLQLKLNLPLSFFPPTVPQSIPNELPSCKFPLNQNNNTTSLYIPTCVLKHTDNELTQCTIDGQMTVTYHMSSEKVKIRGCLEGIEIMKLLTSWWRYIIFYFQNWTQYTSFLINITCSCWDPEKKFKPTYSVYNKW